MSVKVADILGRLDEAFPPERAEPWDVVGLSVGDAGDAVSGVLVTLDPTLEVVDRARDVGANVVVTHHPAFLSPPPVLTPAAAPVAFSAARAGVSLIAAHTNLDRDPAAAALLPALLGLPGGGAPLEESRLPVALVTVYVPAEHERGVADAMGVAGAGRIGEYRGCSFSAEGTGRFTPATTSAPAVGTPGEPSNAHEIRLEMVAPPQAAGAVVRAAREAHPYEEPLICVTETSIARGAARMGRLNLLAEPTTLSALAARAADVFGIVPRVWGEPGQSISAVATATGSAGSLVGAARSSGADVLLAGEVRYHDALAAVESGLAVVEIGHDVSEWPLVELLASAVLSTDGLPPASVIIDRPRVAWWTP